MHSLEKIERSAGIYGYVSRSYGIGGRIKLSEDDFFVEEILDLDLQDKGSHIVLRVTKKNWDTMNFVRVLSNALHISRKAVGYAGTKDKKALTIQHFSIPVKHDELLDRIQKIRIKDVQIEIAGYINRNLKLGDLVGNLFRIVLYYPDYPDKIPSITEDLKERGIPNFFGIQRFGTLRFITHEVGKLILLRKYKEAFWVYVAKPSEVEDHEIRKIRENMWNERDPKTGLKELPKYLIYERNMLQKLREGKSEVEAILSLPKNLKLMFIHAYQSYLFNILLSERIMEFDSLKIIEKDDYADFPVRKRGYLVNSEEFVRVGNENFSRVRFLAENGYAFLVLPLPGYETKLEGWAGEKLKEILEEEEVELDMFRGDYPEFSSKGSYRTAEISFDFDNFGIEVDDDAVTFSFFLPKGCFATSLLREYMKSDYAYFLQK